MKIPRNVIFLLSGFVILFIPLVATKYFTSSETSVPTMTPKSETKPAAMGEINQSATATNEESSILKTIVDPQSGQTALFSVNGMLTLQEKAGGMIWSTNLTRYWSANDNQIIRDKDMGSFGFYGKNLEISPTHRVHDARMVIFVDRETGKVVDVITE